MPIPSQQKKLLSFFLDSNMKISFDEGYQFMISYQRDDSDGDGALNAENFAKLMLVIKMY